MFYLTHRWKERVLGVIKEGHMQQRGFGWGLGIGDSLDLSHSPVDTVNSGVGGEEMTRATTALFEELNEK